MRVQNFFLTLAHRLIALLLTLIVVAEVAHAKPPKSGDMNKFTENNPSIESPSTPFIDPSGKEVTLHEFKNNWTLLNFWATWCAPCISELPSLAKLESKINNSKFKLLLISIDRSGPKVFQPFLKRLGLTSLKSGSDPKASLMRKLGLTGIPTTLLISPTGKVVGKLVGTAKWDTPSAVELVNFYLRN